MPAAAECAPGASRHSLGLIDGIAVLVGVVVGIGIFGLPPLVAQQADNAWIYMGLWLGGGLIALAGALCYAELGAAYPHAGGEYHFLRRAWGQNLGVLFAWARGSVIQTGSIAAAAFIYGEYANSLAPLGASGAAWHAALAVLLLTGLNMLGTGDAKRLQRLFTALTLLALMLVVGAGLFSAPAAELPAGPRTGDGHLLGALGMGMVFVLLTYGGWNEAAYLSGEMRNPGRTLTRALVVGVLLVTLVYLLVNLAYLRIFGLEGLRQSHAVGAELMALVAGPRAGLLLGLMICLAALSTINATILTGARVYFALGQDVPWLAPLGRWHAERGAPLGALAIQALIVLGLLGFGAWAGNGIAAMVAYTAPVFWLFMALCALAVIRLRGRHPEQPRPFRVPFYPWVPLVFALTCLGLFWSSALYAGAGALLGLAVLAAGLPLVWLGRRPLKS